MSFVLDTCVVSELQKVGCPAAVVGWVARQQSDDLFVSVITLGEIRFGLNRMPAGRKRSELSAWMEGFRGGVADRVLPIGEKTAEVWGGVTASSESAGRKVEPADGLIAATAIEHGFTVVTRNVKDFEPTGVAVLNPWSE